MDIIAFTLHFKMYFNIPLSRLVLLHSPKSYTDLMTWYVSSSGVGWGGVGWGGVAWRGVGWGGMEWGGTV